MEINNIIETAGENYIPIAVVACLIVGYLLKKCFTTFPNNKIPATLALIGAVIGCIALKNISLEAIVYGALSGLTSTGMHQAFTRFIEGSDDSQIIDVKRNDVEDLEPEDVEHIDMESLNNDDETNKPIENAEG